MNDLSHPFRAAVTRVLRSRLTVRRGRFETITGFSSGLLANERRVTVYLPPGYEEKPDRRYPVLYMQDGQNLFDRTRSFAGEAWRLGAAADAAIGARSMRPIVIVGVDHAGSDRMQEYTPVRDASKDGGGRGDDYGAMLLFELKPVIDARYRTLAEDTSVGGSSLGGLISLHLALAHPDRIRRALVMSPSVWWAGRAILGSVDALPPGERPRVWLDVGGREGRQAIADARQLRDRMLLNGWTPSNFRFFEDRRGDHSERAWAGRVRRALEFLFPPE